MPYREALVLRLLRRLLGRPERAQPEGPTGSPLARARATDELGCDASPDAPRGLLGIDAWHPLTRPEPAAMALEGGPPPLDGASELDASMILGSVTSPPVGAEVMLFAIERLLELEGRATDSLDARCVSDLSAAIDRGDLAIPALPAIAHELLSLGDHTDLDNLAIGELIGRDQALAAHVLRVANSPFVGATAAGRIQGLDHCVSLLGFDLVRSLAIAAAVSNSLFRCPGYDDEVRALRRHAQAIAEACAAVARHVPGVSMGEAYIAGLFHDVGELVVYRTLSRLRARTRGDRPSPRLVRHLLAELHPTLGLCFAEAQKLPQGLRWAIGYHHAPGLAPEDFQPLTALVGLMDVASDHPEVVPELVDGTHPLNRDASFWPEGMPAVARLLRVRAHAEGEPAPESRPRSRTRLAS